MSDTPQDSSQNAINQGERHEETFEGQEGYGVNYEDGRLEGADVQQPPPAGRSGSYETNNEGGYGNEPPNPDARGTEDNPRVAQ
jgi:hypothetical protein